jgi:Protein of unknown function DUF262
MSYKPRTLFRLIEEINKAVFLPHIQRPFVWEEEQMVRLFDSLMRNYPINTLLFWRTKDEIKARKFMEQIDWDTDLSVLYDPNMSKEGNEKVFVLDGQQRLQSLYAIFYGAISEPDNKRAEAYFDTASGISPDELGLMYGLRFSPEALPLPWYRVADLIGKDAQKNAEELAEGINIALDTIDTAKTIEQKPTAQDSKARGTACSTKLESTRIIAARGEVLLGSRVGRGGERLPIRPGAGHFRACELGWHKTRRVRSDVCGNEGGMGRD